MMLLFPGQAVHCHLFMSFLALPSFSFSHPTVNMEIVFVSLCVYTLACMHIYTCAFVQRPLMSVCYTALNANLCSAPVWMQFVQEGHVVSAEKTSPSSISSINKHTPSFCCSIDSQSSVFSHLFSPLVALSHHPLKTQQDFYWPYYSELPLSL